MPRLSRAQNPREPGGGDPYSESQGPGLWAASQSTGNSFVISPACDL